MTKIEDPRTVYSVTTKYDRELWDAWMAGFDVGYENGRDGGDYPVRWSLRREYWGWRDRRRKGES